MVLSFLCTCSYTFPVVSVGLDAPWDPLYHIWGLNAEESLVNFIHSFSYVPTNLEEIRIFTAA